MGTTITYKNRAAALILAFALATTPLAGCSAHQVSPQIEPTAVSTTTGDENGAADAAMKTDGYAATESEDLLMYEVEPGYSGEAYVNWNTEEYATVDEGGFIMVSTRPLSTVSADVDTASWCNLRRMVRDGYTLSRDTDGSEVDEWGYYDYYGIPAGAVRIEEMLNYFTYDYAAPKDGERFSITTHLGPCPWNPDTELLTLGFASAPEDTASAKGRNLVFLIDVSGSMDSSDKLGLLQDAFSELVKQLDKNDRVSIVTYASGEELVLEGATGDQQREIMRAINHLRADGSTNGERGLQLAYEVAERNFIEGGVNRIVLASDGDLNVGMTSESDLHDFVSKKRETGVYLSVLGFGSGNYKDTKMETLADDGNGSYHYIDCEEEAERVFGERLCANLVPFADDVKVQVEFNPEQVKAYRLIGYENRELADEDFRDDTVDAGETGPGMQFTVAYEIVRPDSKYPVAGSDLKYQETVSKGSDEWLTATLRYHAYEDDTVHEQSSVVGTKAWTEDPGEDWRFQAAVIELGMMMRDSEFAGSSSFDSIRELAKADRDGFVDVVDELEFNSR